jgi:hypothetical protein
MAVPICDDKLKKNRMNKYLAVIIIMILILENVNAQRSFVRKYNTYISKTEEKLIISSKDDPFDSGFLNNKKIIVVPCFSYHGVKKISNSNLLSIMSQDAHEFTYSLTEVDSTIYAIPEVLYLTGNFMIGRYEKVERKDLRAYNDMQLNMVMYAQQFSSVFFFLDIFSEWILDEWPLVYFKDGKMRFLDWQMNEYSSIETYIKKQFGCMDKFLELNSKFLQKITLAQNISKDSCQKIYNKDFQKWEKHHPNDTANIFRLFYDEVKELAGLTDEQTLLLKTTLDRRFSFIPSCKNSCTIGLLLMGKNVDAYLRTFLTTDQYNDYYKKKDLLTWLEDVIIEHPRTTE